MMGGNDLGGFPMIDAMAGGDGLESDEADPVSRLKRLISERQEDTVRILQSWIEDPEERHEA